MIISETSLTLAPSDIEKRDGILAFGRLVVGGSLAVRDLKVMAKDGFIFLGFPSRKICDKCSSCGAKNALLDKFCCNCGANRNRVKDSRKVFADVCYPITREARRAIEQAVVDAYNALVEPNRHLKVPS